MVTVLMVLLPHCFAGTDRSRIISTVTHTVTHTTKISHRIVISDAISSNTFGQEEERDEIEVMKKVQCTDIHSRGLLQGKTV